jgi:hypothetical protein
MKQMTFSSFSFTLRAVLAVATILSAATLTSAQCTEVVTGLRQPLGTALTNQGNLVVSESGVRILPGTAVIPGRISIVDPEGNRRTLLDGLPSALNDVGDASGPAGVFMRGRTLYVAVGVGDVVISGGGPGLARENPAGPSSPLFSSVLAIHFSANAENTSDGFTLSFADQQSIAAGETVTLSNGAGDNLTIRMIADFPNFIALTPPFVAASNPFQLTAIEDHLFVTDGGRNLIWDINLLTDTFSILTTFPKIANPLTPLGPPLIDAVLTGIAVDGHQLLVTLFTGFPFPAGSSSVQQVDPATGTFGTFIGGRRTAVGVLPIDDQDDTDFLVLQHSSPQVAPLPPFSGPGLVLRFETPTDAPTTIASCLTRPTSMTLNKKAAILYVSELSGRIVSIPIAP